MPRDRQTRRALLLPIGIVCSAISSGCLKTANLRAPQDPPPESSPSAQLNPGNRPVAIAGPAQRPADAPVQSEVSSATEASVPTASSPVIGASAGTVTPPAAGLVSAPPPTVIAPPQEPSAVTPIEIEAAVIEPRSAAATSKSPAATSTTPVGQSPAVPPTPLLDAANQRIAAVMRQQNESRDASATSAEPDEEILARLARRASEVDAVRSKATTDAQLVVATATARSADPPSPPPRIEADASPAPPPAPVAQQEKANEKKPEPPAPDQTPATSLPAAAPVNRAVPEEDAAPGINELRLCRTVSGFGSFEPLNENSVKAGQTLLIYCELTRLRYELKDAGFASRISSRVEIRPSGGGPIQWEHDWDAAEDVCRRRRHDYYVNYRVDLPRSLPPGSYILRLIQTDLVANRSTAAEIPLMINP